MNESAEPLVILFACSQLGSALKHHGFKIQELNDKKHLFSPSSAQNVRVILLGPTTITDASADEMITVTREAWPLVDIVVWSPNADSNLVRMSLNAGARDVLLWSNGDKCAGELLKIVQAQQLLPRSTQSRGDNQKEHVFEGIYARSRCMWDLFDLTARIAYTDATVLVLGETGTGKELLARAIHRMSQRSGRFVPLNCGAINETLVDSELFGHVKGAFTGAHSNKEGLFSHANHGTLFLDEIGNVPLTAQYHLLRALQESTIRPVGSQSELPIDVRVIAATSNDLTEDVTAGNFREDLLYRLDVIRLEIPPLRERPDDIVFLFAHFAKKVSKEYNVSRPDLKDEFLDALCAHPWYGNVRELENFTERAILTQTGQRLGSQDFEDLIAPSHRRPKFGGALFDGTLNAKTSGGSRNPRIESHDQTTPKRCEDDKTAINTTLTLAEHLEPNVNTLERDYLIACLRETGGKISLTAERAGISRRTLLRKMKQHQLDKASFKAPRPT
jgi:DNA-binding NtrC family response regulator